MLQFGVAFKVFLVTALMITRHLNQWLSAEGVGGGEGQVRPPGNFWPRLETFLVYHSSRRVATGMSWGKDISR